MARSKPRAKSKPEPKQEGRRFRIELSGAQALLYSLGLVAALAWMFIFGILVGRGIPLTPAGDSSFKGRLSHFLGLDRPAPKPVANASQTWKSTEQMLQALTYHDDLKGKPEPPATASAPPEAAAPSARPASPPGKKDETPQSSTASHYVLMVASLRNKDNADSLIADLKAKGYSPWMEAVEMSEGGLWYRVLVGSFSSRQDAQQFAAAFNRQEKMQGLVIQVGP